MILHAGVDNVVGIAIAELFYRGRTSHSLSILLRKINDGAPYTDTERPAGTDRLDFTLALRGSYSHTTRAVSITRLHLMSRMPVNRRQDCLAVGSYNRCVEPLTAGCCPSPGLLSLAELS